MNKVFSKLFGTKTVYYLLTLLTLGLLLVESFKWVPIVNPDGTIKTG